MNETTITDEEVDALLSPRYQLLMKVADTIDAHPELYQQEHWGYRPSIDCDEWYLDQPEALTYYNPSINVEECGSKYCVAGLVAQMQGWYPTVDLEHDSSGRNVSRIGFDFGVVANKPLVILDRVKGRLGDVQEDGTIVMSVMDLAQTELGLNKGEASDLFSAGAVWTTDDLRDIARGKSPNEVATKIDYDRDSR